MSEFRVSFYVTGLTLETTVAAESMEAALARGRSLNFWTLLAPDVAWVDSDSVEVDGVWQFPEGLTEDEAESESLVKAEGLAEAKAAGNAKPEEPEDDADPYTADENELLDLVMEDEILESMTHLTRLLEKYEAQK